MSWDKLMTQLALVEREVPVDKCPKCGDEYWPCTCGDMTLTKPEKKP